MDDRNIGFVSQSESCVFFQIYLFMDGSDNRSDFSLISNFLIPRQIDIQHGCRNISSF